MYNVTVHDSNEHVLLTVLGLVLELLIARFCLYSLDLIAMM
jgi:hypothetical protein